MTRSASCGPWSSPAAADHQGPARGRRGSAGRRSRRQGRRIAELVDDARAAAWSAAVPGRPQADRRLGRVASATGRPAPGRVRARVGLRRGLAAARRRPRARSGWPWRRRSCAAALDKLGVEPQFEQRHEYKNAADRLTRTELTPAHRESLDGWPPRSTTTRCRPSPPAGTCRPTGCGSSSTPARGRRPRPCRRGLVDRLGYRDEVLDRPAGADEPTTRRCCSPIGGDPAGSWPCPVRHRQHVALVDVRGMIVPGRTRYAATGRQVGSDTVVPSCGPRAIRTRSAAVVLRVDSPGGSAVASDTIWREVGRLRAGGKPVVVSMGDVAGVRRLLHRLRRGRHRGAAVHAHRVDRRARRQAGPEGSARAGRPDTGTVQRGEHALTCSARRPFSDDGAGLAGGHDRRDLRRLRGQGRRRARTGPLPRSRPSPAAGSGRAGMRSRSDWSTSSAGCATPCGSPGLRRICRRTHRCSGRCTCRRWPGWERPRTARIRVRCSEAGLGSATSRLPSDCPQARRSCGCRRSACADGPGSGEGRQDHSGDKGIGVLVADLVLLRRFRANHDHQPVLG